MRIRISITKCWDLRSVSMGLLIKSKQPKSLDYKSYMTKFTLIRIFSDLAMLEKRRWATLIPIRGNIIVLWIPLKSPDLPVNVVCMPTKSR